MAYIGAEPAPGQNRAVDDISSSFNGSTTAFTLQVSGVNFSPESANNILVSLGGVMQKPGTDYTIAAATITFTTAPASGLSFWALILGDGIDTATVADQTIGPSKLLNTAVTAGSYTTADITVDAQGRITAAASGSISGAEIANNAVTTAKIADSTGASDGVTTAKIATSAITTAKIADQAVDLSKLPHGTGSNNGKFLRANNGADPTFETVTTDLVNDTTPQLGGNLDCNGNNISLDNNNQINLGNDNDLILKVTDTNSTITHSGTGQLFISAEGTDEDLYLSATDDIFLRVNGSNDGIKVIGAGAVELYHSNSKKFESTTNGIGVNTAQSGYGLTLPQDSAVASHVGWIDSGGTKRAAIKCNSSGDTLDFHIGASSTVVTQIDTSGHLRPATNNTHDLGTSSLRWRNVYTNDLNLSNEGSSNDVDGTWGSYTIQEGAEDLFLINKRNGKKYKFNLTEVS